MPRRHQERYALHRLGDGRRPLLFPCEPRQSRGIGAEWRTCAASTLTSTQQNKLPHLSRQPMSRECWLKRWRRRRLEVHTKVANTVAYLGNVLLRAYEADAAHSANTPAQPCVPVIYRALSFRDGLKH